VGAVPQIPPVLADNQTIENKNKVKNKPKSHAEEGDIEEVFQGWLLIVNRHGLAATVP
jgi:hypothetical protein